MLSGDDTGGGGDWILGKSASQPAQMWFSGKVVCIPQKTQRSGITAFSSARKSIIALSGQIDRATTTNSPAFAQKSVLRFAHAPTARHPTTF
jgi:hypothetical protein